ncbi:hypothetical protein EV361DRAFT_1011293 [Lentinula raphanica]|nr:hypothetical protein EV361DRAFT_1011293 [Lentinula raphanica]
MNGMISNDDDLLVGEGNGGFDQELATLMSSERSTASSTASTGSTASSSISSSASSATTTTGTTNDYVHRTHNILDMGITVRPPSSSQTQSQSPSLPHSQTHNLSQSPPLPSIPTHFNSTLPALNSSMRYEPLPDSANANNSATNTNKGGNSSMTPTGESPGLSQTAHNHTPLWGGVTRHTPSPHPHAATSPSRASHPYALSSRSRSRSRQPSVSVYSGSSSPSMGGFMMSPGGGNGIGGVSGGGGIGAGGSVGLQRRRRERRGNNVWSMTSVTRVSVSPPLHGHGRGGTSSAIVIPRHEQQQQGVADGWFGSAGSQGTTGEYTLPTPESLHDHPHSQTRQPSTHSPLSFHRFANLSLNVSNLHNHPNAHNAHSHTHMGSLSSPLNTVNVGGYPGQGMIGGIGNINTNTNNNNPNNTTNASNTSSSFTQNGHWPSSPSAGGDTQQFGLRTPCYRSIRLPLVQEDPVVVEARIRPPPPTLLPPPPLPCEEAPPNSTTSLSQTKHPRRQEPQAGGDDKKSDPSTASATGAAGSGGVNDDSSSVVKMGMNGINMNVNMPTGMGGMGMGMNMGNIGIGNVNIVMGNANAVEFDIEDLKNYHHNAYYTAYGPPSSTSPMLYNARGVEKSLAALVEHERHTVGIPSRGFITDEHVALSRTSCFSDTTLCSSPAYDLTLIKTHVFFHHGHHLQRFSPCLLHSSICCLLALSLSSSSASSASVLND